MLRIFKEIKWGFQRLTRKYSDDMCYSVYDTILEILPDMIEQMRKYKNGYPELDFEEVNTFPSDWIKYNLKVLEEEFKAKDYDIPTLQDPFVRWHLILRRITYCLIQADESRTKIENEYDKEYSDKLWNIKDSLEDGKLSTSEWFKKHTEPIKFDDDGKPKLYAFKFNEVDPKLKQKWFERDKEIATYRDDMKTEALNLLNKYFWNLWD